MFHEYLASCFKRMSHVAIKLISVLVILLKGSMSLVYHRKTRLCKVWQPFLPFNNSVTPPQVYSKASELNSSVLTYYTWHHLEMSCINMKNRSALGSQTLQGSKWDKTSCQIMSSSTLILFVFLPVILKISVGDVGWGLFWRTLRH